MWGWVTNEKIPFPICLCLGWSQVIKQWELPVADQPSTSPQRWCAGAFLHPNEPLQELREKWGLWWGTATAMTQIRGLGGWGMWFSFCWDRGGECCGQGVRCRLAADSPGTSAGKKDPLRRHGRIHTVVSEYLRKNHGARECKILIDQLFYLFLMVLQRCPPPVWSLLSRKKYGNLKIVC